VADHDRRRPSSRKRLGFLAGRAEAASPAERATNPSPAVDPASSAPTLPPTTTPVVSLDDPRAVQILTAEHGSLLSARSLAYNEAFTRGGNFLAFLSTSFVALALGAQVLPERRDLLLVAAAVLALDVIVGLTTFGRIIVAGFEDYRAVQGMARIRHAYVEVAPIVSPYFSDSTHDDLSGVMVAYGSPPTRGVGAILYNLTTSAGAMVLTNAILSAVLALVVAVAAGGTLAFAVGTAILVGLSMFAALAYTTYRYYARVQARVDVLFPTPVGAGEDGETRTTEERPGA
jgi:hypothetical protein